MNSIYTTATENPNLIDYVLIIPSKNLLNDDNSDGFLDLTDASEYNKAQISSLNKPSKKITKAPRRANIETSGPAQRKRVVWNASEDKLVWLLYKTVGPQWSKISECLEGKTEAQVKYRFNNYLKKKAGAQEESHQQLMKALMERYEGYSR